MDKKANIRKLTVTGPGRSYYLTLPKKIIKALKWKKGEKKVVVKEGKRIIIEDWKP
jgi:bifunctional DNA-binding transcriptional regulator/antitoxin component of YhaV-PrlF toxin-antitoxin module